MPADTYIIVAQMSGRHICREWKCDAVEWDVVPKLVGFSGVMLFGGVGRCLWPPTFFLGNLFYFPTTQTFPDGAQTEFFETPEEADRAAWWRG